ncbi:MAG: 2OG-Fe(II) oxygenase [Nitrospirales bacterium]|nr:2OG-Fe(II) oxygenase [Nitrospira sp.]MDR4502218.1 2OG-Fe(II) oxygenase [Nitrospirales bacterium]
MNNEIVKGHISSERRCDSAEILLARQWGSGGLRPSTPLAAFFRQPHVGSDVMIARIQDVNVKEAEHALYERGVATIANVVDPATCEELIARYDDTKSFRKRVNMEQHNFGVGDYAYFAEPLPRLVAGLRTQAYRQLVPVANRMMRDMGLDLHYPATLKQFRAYCREHGQTHPTPLLLHYQAGGMNRLHRDVYGPTLFPLQMMIMLNQKGRDYEGGEFVLVENRPRQQSQATVLTPAQGDLVIFPVSERPISGRRGMLRASVRHGVSRIHSGERWALGIIFHDAR